MSMVQLSIFASFELAVSFNEIVGDDSMGENRAEDNEIVPVGGLTSSTKDWLLAVPGENAVP